MLGIFDYAKELLEINNNNWNPLTVCKQICTDLKNTNELLNSKSCIYIYIVIDWQIVSFHQNSSVWLDTQDARSWDRIPSNFTLD